MEKLRPAWSWGAGTSQSGSLTALEVLKTATPDNILGGSTGRGVKVAIIDSGIDDTHPAVAGAVRGWVEPVVDDEGAVTYDEAPHDDLFGHGTPSPRGIPGKAPQP